MIVREVNTDHLTISEFAKLMRVTSRTIHNWRVEGRLRCVKLPNGRYLVPQSEYERIMRYGEDDSLLGGFSVCRA